MATLASLVDLLFTLYTFLIIARVVLTWARVDPYHPVAGWIYRLTEPVLAPIRNLMPPSGMYDWSPVVAMFLVIILRYIVVSILLSL